MAFVVRREVEWLMLMLGVSLVSLLVLPLPVVREDRPTFFLVFVLSCVIAYELHHFLFVSARSEFP